MRTVPASNQRMSKENSPALQSKLVLASETEEVVTPIPPPIGLTTLTTSLKTLNAGMDKRLTVVQCTQPGPSLGATRNSGSLEARGPEEDFTRLKWRVRCISLAGANEILAGLRGWRTRIGGESAYISRNSLPLCLSTLTSQLMPFPFSCRLPCQPLG